MPYITASAVREVSHFEMPVLDPGGWTAQNGIESRYAVGDFRGLVLWHNLAGHG
ncbi:MAG: hypothetical protein ABR898_02390 [Terracidiphilus sp.]